MKRKRGKAVFMIILGIAIAAIPFIARQREQDRTNQYVKEFEEDEDESEETANRKKKDALLLEKGVIGIIEIPSLNLIQQAYVEKETVCLPDTTAAGGGYILPIYAALRQGQKSR